MPRNELRLTLPDHPGSFGSVADAPGRLASSVGSPSLAGASTPWLPLSGPRTLSVDRDWVPDRWGLSEQQAAVAAGRLAGDLGREPVDGPP